MRSIRIGAVIKRDIIRLTICSEVKKGEGVQIKYEENTMYVERVLLF